MKIIRPMIVLLLVMGSRVMALDAEHQLLARQMLEKATAYLLTQQSAQGAWLPEAGPAVTGLIASGLIRDEAIGPRHRAVGRALDYILSQQRSDGAIHSGILENYNTSICLMALARAAEHLDDPRLPRSIAAAQDFLRQLQWSAQNDPSGTAIDEKHPWYGGAGYGNHGRPDLSNTAMLLAGLHDSGLNCNDPAYQRAMTFITRLQGTKANVAFGDKIEPDGGFIYATSESREKIGVPQTYAVPPTALDSQGRSRLRTYGSMTYAGFMSYLYAEVDRQDPRVRDAVGWLRRRYTLKENPGAGMQGYYYYLHLFGRAMDAWGENPFIDSQGHEHDWANELIDTLAALQRPDGSFVNEKDRWMEGQPVLVTGYAVAALQTALGR